MRTLMAVALLVAPLTAAADSIHDNYQHSTSVAIRLTDPAEVTSRDTSSGTMGAVAKGSNVWFTFSDDGYTCRLSGKITGHSIRFHAGQSCRWDDEDSEARFKLSLVAGQGTVDDDGNLDLSMSWKIRGSMQGQAVEGAANQRTTATPL